MLPVFQVHCSKNKCNMYSRMQNYPDTNQSKHKNLVLSKFTQLHQNCVKCSVQFSHFDFDFFNTSQYSCVKLEKNYVISNNMINNQLKLISLNTAVPESRLPQLVARPLYILARLINEFITVINKKLTYYKIRAVYQINLNQQNKKSFCTISPATEYHLLES